MEPFAELSALPLRQIWESATVRTVDGERLTLGIVELDANAVVPEHRHDHEQLGIVLRGMQALVVDGVPHEVRVGPEGAVVIDVFAPVRQDWGAVEPAAARPARWP